MRYWFISLLLISHSIWASPEVTLLHVSYDPTRELYQSINKAFGRYWFGHIGQKIFVRQSHAGSSKQARAIIDGLEADVVSLAMPYDIDQIVKKTGLIESHWRQKMPYNSSPYYSTLVFLVRKNNPKHIKDWKDLSKVSVICPNPKTSGIGRYAILSIWYDAWQTYQNQKDASRFLGKVIHNIPVLDTGSRGATTTFLERQFGDVLLTWENEALLIAHKFPQKVDIVYPSYGFEAPLPVTVVDNVARQKKTLSVAKAYCLFLFSKQGQEIGAHYFFRPRDPEVMRRFRKSFTDIRLISVESAFGNWQKINQTFFNKNGLFDHILEGR